VRSFQDALEMVRGDGTVHLIGLYHSQPLPLDASKIQRKLLIGGYHVSAPLRTYADRAAELLATGGIRVDPLITHRFPAEQAPAAFGLLDQHLDQALGVLLEWDRA
jgi:threonine dehydrogenase-like Zn-dependent dehydrogenase